MSNETEPSRTSPAEPGAGVSFVLSDDGLKLRASYVPVSVRAPLDEAWVREKIVAEGFGSLFLHEAALTTLIELYASSTEAFSIEIAEVRDAEVSVEITPDKMSALLSIIPPFGGSAASVEQIRRALIGMHVTSGILDDAIEQAVTSGLAEQLEVARGQAAENGEDGHMECLIDMVKSRHPHIDEKGVADYRDLGSVVVVCQGQRLMCKHPPTPGRNGENVLGQAVVANSGKDIMFAPQLKGAMIDPQDAAFLIAEIAGQPVMANYGMTVEPSITIPTVDLTTGNIDFDGTVEIQGDVHAGMTIRATGDIHIAGTVEAATIEAGGDVVVKGGIIGHGEVHDQPVKSEKSMIARVRAGASCSALFIENASVEAKDSIMVDRLVMQSELIAMNQIVVGKPGSGQGNIVGGLTEATLLVQAGQIGSESGVRTRIMVGTNPYLHENLKHAKSALEKKNHEMEELDKLLAFIAAHPGRIKPEIVHKAESTRTMLGQEIEGALQELNEIMLELNLSEDARVVAEKMVYSNVQIEIGGKIHRVEIERGKGAFMRREEEIVFE